MISNAKSFNQKTSQIYSDAEKVRKLVSNFMVDRNPAYKDENYQAIATPVPPGWKPGSRSLATPVRSLKEEIKTEQQSNELTRGRRASRNAAQTSSERESQRASTPPTAQDSENDTAESFEGNNFQQAQKKIVKELMELTDDE